MHVWSSDARVECSCTWGVLMLVLSRSASVSYPQVVIAGRAQMVGKTIRELRFRTKFDAAVIAVHR